MSDYGRFFDDEMKRRQDADAQAQAERRQKQAEKEAALRALSDPLDAVLNPALGEAERQLAGRGIAVARQGQISHNVTGNFTVYRAFRLEQRRGPGGGQNTSKVFVFGVYSKGNIEAGVIDYPPSSGHARLDRISLTPASSFSATQVEEVVRAAIADLVSSAR